MRRGAEEVIEVGAEAAVGLVKSGTKPLGKKESPRS